MKKIILILLLWIIPAVSAQLADSPWPMYHGGASHGGLSPYDTSHVNGEVKWIFEADGAIESSPVIGPDGTIYFGTHENNLYAVNPDGTLKWTFDCGDPVSGPSAQGDGDIKKGIISTPAVDVNGTIYFTSLSNYMFALNPDGTEKWRYPVHVYIDVWSSPVIGPDGTIYVGSQQYPPGQTTSIKYGGRLYAMNPDGTEKWNFDSGSAGMSGSPAIAGDGTIYATGGGFSDLTGTVYAFEPDGKVKWKFRFEQWQESHPTITEDGTIVIGSKEGDIRAINPDGTEKWRYPTEGGNSAAPAIRGNGNIYVGSWDSWFYAFTPDGELLWKFKTPEFFEAITSSAAIGSDGTIYFGHSGGEIYALNPEGTEKWRYHTRSAILTSPAIDSDGTVYIGSYDGKLIAFGKGGDDAGITMTFNDDVTEEDVTDLMQGHRIPYLFSSSLWESKKIKIYPPEEQVRMFTDTFGREDIVKSIGPGETERTEHETEEFIHEPFERNYSYDESGKEPVESPEHEEIEEETEDEEEKLNIIGVIINFFINLFS